MVVQTGIEIKNVICGLCSDHCRVQVEVNNGRVVRQFYEMKKSSKTTQKWHTVVTSCARARSVVEFLDHPQRLNYPLKRVGARGENKWQRVSWQETLDDIATRLAELRDK